MVGPISAATAVLALFQSGGQVSATNEKAVKLWVDTAAESACEQAAPASGAWLIRNNENRNVHVVLQRSTTKNGATAADKMQDTLGPHETLELGCELTEDGRQTLSVVRVSF